MQIFQISVDVHANEHPTLVALKLEKSISMKIVSS